jgi:LemA protein
MVARDARRRPTLAAAALGLGLSGCGTIDAIPTLEQRAHAAWREVQTQHQRRADLIPTLVETVKSVAAQEREALSQVIDARTRAIEIRVDASTLTQPETFRHYQEAQNELSRALRALLLALERYPALKSNASFQALLAQLDVAEARIAVARRDHAEAVQAYNTELRTIPGRWIAAVFHPGAKPMETFTASAAGPDRPRPARP